jgi:peptide/nickel transport system substrate-binding protein
MHRRIWFLVGAAAASMVVAGSAAGIGSASGKVLAARPFATAWANVPRTPAARAAKKTMVFGLEQTVNGFNLGNATENATYAAIVAGSPVNRGAYYIDNKSGYHLDAASKVLATKKFLRIWIRKDANWYWVGHKLTPVTAGDFIYTWKQFLKKGNAVASNTGYINIASAKKNNNKEVTFYWKPGQAFPDYRDLFGYIYPGFALGGVSFDEYWHNCVCGKDGKPITDGPFYLSSYTPGEGMVLTKNPHFYGKKAGLNQIVFKIQTNTDSEIQAMKGGEYDAIYPSPESALSTLVNDSNLVYSSVNSLTQEHWDIEVGNPQNPLLKQLYIRQALALGMNRQSLITALYGTITKGLTPLNNTVFNQGPDATGKNAFFAQYNFNAAKAISTLKSHGCTGGPSSPSSNNNKVWTCNGHKTEFLFQTTTRASREASGQIFQQQLMAVGIKLDTQFIVSGTFFGTTLPAANFDIGEYAWGQTSPDPSGWDSIYQCYGGGGTVGGSNYKRYCNPTVDSLIKAADKNFNPATRLAQYEQVAKLTSDEIAVIPLYASPNILVYKKGLKGIATANNALSNPSWDIQAWHW